MALNKILGAPLHEEAPQQEKQIPSKENGRQALSKLPAMTRKRNWLNQALLENSPTRPKSTFWDVALSVAIHSALVITLILIPLYFTEAIDVKEFTTTFLVAPPPPPPPPPPPAAPAASVAPKPKVPKVRLIESGRLVAPTAVPKEVANLKEEAAAAPELTTGVVGGVPGGVPGGQVGGVIGGVVSGAPSYVPPAPKAEAPKEPIRVGGRVSAPKAKFSPSPDYPPLARTSRIQGEVVIDAVIDANGNVVEMKALSGHPMLVPAAMEALRKWKYQPTVLNDVAVPVKLTVIIRFNLQQ